MEEKNGLKAGLVSRTSSISGYCFLIPLKTGVVRATSPIAEVLITRSRISVFFVGFFLNQSGRCFNIYFSFNLRSFVIFKIYSTGSCNKIITKIFFSFKIADMVFNIPQFTIHLIQSYI